MAEPTRRSVLAGLGAAAPSEGDAQGGRVDLDYAVTDAVDRFGAVEYRAVHRARDGVDAEPELVAEHEWHEEVPRTSC